jgi:hypothetical protein
VTATSRLRTAEPGPYLRGARRTSSPSQRDKYQLDVIATDVVDVVRSAGGWLFDLASTGWKVHVAGLDRCDIRPLQILGISSRESSTPASVIEAPDVVALAFSGDVLTDVATRVGVLNALAAGIAEITLWGKNWTTEIPDGLEPMPYRPSAAARAFKAQALIALGSATEPIGSIEEFYTPRT